MAAWALQAYLHELACARGRLHALERYFELRLVQLLFNVVHQNLTIETRTARPKTGGTIFGTSQRMTP